MERKSLLPLVKNVSNIVKKTKEMVRGDFSEKSTLNNSNRGIFSDGALDRVIGIVSRMEGHNGEYQLAEDDGLEQGK